MLVVDLMYNVGCSFDVDLMYTVGCRFDVEYTLWYSLWTVGTR